MTHSAKARQSLTPRRPFWAVSALFVLLLGCTTTQAPKPGVKHTFVIVHGATGGGWDWKTVDGMLRAQGHDVYRPTLSGLGERHHLPKQGINLSTHITDITNLLAFEELSNVTLVGHSYGGIVITGVMNAMPERIQHAVFVDAGVPDHGMSALDVFDGLSVKDRVEDDLVFFEWLDPDAPFPKDMPHPVHSLTESVSFDNARAKRIPATFIAFVPKGTTVDQRTKDASWRRAEARGWTMLMFSGDHTAYRERPKAFSELLNTVAEGNQTSSLELR